MSETTHIFQKELGLRGKPVVMLGKGFAPLLALLDALLIVILSVSVGMIYHHFAYGDGNVAQTYLPAGMMTAFFYVTLQSIQKQYDIAQTFADPIAVRRIFYLWNIAIFFMLVIAFSAKITDVYSRVAVILFYFSGLMGLWLIRAATVSAVRRGFHRGWLASKRLMLLGTAERIQAFRDMMTPTDYGLQIADLEVLPEHEKDESEEHFSSRFRHILNRTVDKVRLRKVDSILLLIPWAESQAIEACRKAFREVPAITVLALEPGLGRAVDIGLSRIGPAAGLSLGREPLTGFETFLKRAMDIVIASVALILLAPVLALFAVLIKLESAGPVLFVQYRHGFNQEPFKIYKFRSMTVMEDGEEFVQAVENDPRVTRVGRFMRRWNIDELPQILNVLKGEMSIVGPRPHPLVHNEDFQNRIALYARRHNVKPGITGWAQVNGYRGPTDTDEKMRGRVDHDLYYIDNWSIWFDIQIILMTLFSRRAFKNAL